VHFRAIGKKLSISILNQGVNSITNFAIGIYLVQNLTAEDFGLYGIGFAVMLFYSGIGNALFLTQMVVNMPDKNYTQKNIYASSILFSLMIFCLLTLILVFIILNCIFYKWVWIYEYKKYIIVVTVASVSYLIKDFFVRQAYTARKETNALKINIVVAFTLTIMLIAQSPIFIDKMTVNRAFWFLATSNFLGAFTGLISDRLPMHFFNMKQICYDAKETWINGRWAVGGVMITWSQSQAFIYITAMLLGPVGVGQVNAARLLIAPAVFLLPALNNFAMPRLADVRKGNKALMIRQGINFSFCLLVIAFVYTLVIMSLADFLIPVFIGSKYKEIKTLLPAWCLVLIINFGRNGAGILLQVMKQFRALMIKNIISAAFTIILATFLIYMCGVSGGLIAISAGEFVLALILWKKIWNERATIR